MSYLVLARKYRPQSFAEMAGQEHVVRTLANALRSGQLAHAFLFTGPRGVGKTTSARLVAKCLNCVNGPTAEPCGVCAPCVEIAEGRAVDVVEIDAASNNGVDNVRDIVEAVKYRPARDRFKIFIVDEVHMLSTGAFNALLKTLEEPPEHVKFVLATTDVHKVPETIVSRCQRFDFRRLTQAQLVAQLRKVADAEALRVSDAALALVARSAEGGMRDALSMLDQVRAACGDEASDEAVAEAVGAIDAGAIARLGAALLSRDGAALLSTVDALHARGQEMKRVAEELTRHLRNVIVAKLVPQAPLDLTDAERSEVSTQAAAASAAQLTRIFDLVQASAQDLKQSEQPRYAFEVALLEACFLAPGADVQELIARLDGMGGGGGALLVGGTPGCAGGTSTSTSNTTSSPTSNRSPSPNPTSTPSPNPTSTAPSPRPSPPLRGGEGESRTATEASGGGPRSPSPATAGEGRGEGPSTAPAARAAATDDPSLPTPERWRRAVAE
ncbi:MAG TPA: DNA polymerase III subunit gamma/tau, partial [Anaeromyxobacteraceae bacterium]|nr:DNA polymerase III subunit gamma/tau [Anaeromyxobacteraceae bacterium]